MPGTEAATVAGGSGISSDQLPPDDLDPELTVDLPEGPAAYDAASLVGTRLGDYELLREIGRGGMGVVYEARQISLNRKVALKLLPPGLGLTETAVRRFTNEAQAAARLHHSNIVPVHASGCEAGHYFYAMELVAGEGGWDRILDDLRQLRPNPLFNAALEKLATSKGKRIDDLLSGDAVSEAGSTPGTSSRQWFDAVATLLADVADGLHYAHEQGVVHRDIKPGNLLMAPDGRLCVTDFGLARVADEPALTMSGSLLGTPAYMAPEQIAAGRIAIDRRVDVYSLGAVLYETLTMQRPFTGASRDEILTGIMTRDPRPPRRVNSRVPVDLETICLKALEKDPDRRYQTAGELADDLRAFLRRGLIAARRPSPWRRMTKFVRRHPVAVTVAMAALVLAASVGSIARITAERGRVDAVQRTLAETRYLRGEGRHKLGLERVDEALAQAPGHPEALLLKARLLLDLGRGQEAVAIAEGVLAEDPDAWIAHMIMVMAIRDGALSVPATVHMAEIERLAPDTAEYLFMRALVERRHSDQLPWLDRALARDPGLAAAVLFRGECHVGLRDFESALADAERLTAMRPRSALGPCLKGEIRRELHDYDGALADLAQAIDVEPDYTMSYILRCGVHAEMGNYAAAVADLDQALVRRPDDLLALVVRASAFMSMGRYDEAIADAERALEIQPDYIFAYMPLGYATALKGDFSELEPLLKRVSATIMAIPEPVARAEAILELAGGLGMIGDFDSALVAISMAIGMVPDDPQYLLSRARLHSHAGDRVAMRADCERAAAMTLEEVGALLDRAERLNSICGLREFALADCDRIIEMAPRWAEGWYQRGRIRRDLGEYEASHADLARASELAPQWSLPHLMRAYNCEREGRPDEALAFYEQFFARDDKINVRWRRARLLLQLEREGEAFADIEFVKAHFPDRNSGHKYEAWAHNALGRLPEAMAAMDRAEAVQPDVEIYRDRAEYRALTPGMAAGAREDMAAMMRQLPRATVWHMHDQARLEFDWLPLGNPGTEDLARADSLVTLARAERPDEWQFVLAMAKVRHRQGRFREAQELLDQAAGMQDGEPSLYTHLYMALNQHALGRTAAAREWYAGAVARIEEDLPRTASKVMMRRHVARELGIDTP